MTTRRVVIRGRVQGVGFRWTAATEAERIGVAGTIRNFDDGAVQVVVVGDPEPVDRFTEWLRVGPPGARVDDIETQDLPDADPPPTGFRIL